MKKLILILALVMGASSLIAADAANDVLVNQRNGANDDNVQQNVSATVNALFAFNGSLAPISTLTPTGLTSLGVNSVTAATSTPLTLTGGSTGASLVLGQGSSATSLVGTGNVKIGFNAASGALATFGVSSGSAVDGPYLQIRGKNELNAEGWAQIILNSSNAAASSGSFQINQYDGASFNEVLRTTKLRNLLIGTTTDMSGTGGLKVAGTTAATTTTSGALIVAGGVGVSGAGYFGGLVYSGSAVTGTWSPDSSFAQFAHSTFVNSTTGFGLIQSSSGNTQLNGATSSSISIGNSAKLSLTSTVTTLNSSNTVNVANTTSASTSTTGALTIGNGTAATNVAIGGGGIWAGTSVRGGTATDYGTLTSGGLVTTNSSDTATVRSGVSIQAPISASSTGPSLSWSGVGLAELARIYPTRTAGSFATKLGFQTAQAGGTLTTGMEISEAQEVKIPTTLLSTGVGSGALQVAGGIYAGAASVFAGAATFAGDVALSTAGKTISVKSGTNAAAGTVTLVAGNGTITSTAIDANTVIVMSIKTKSGSFDHAPSVVVSAGSAAIDGHNADASTYNWIALKVN